MKILVTGASGFLGGWVLSVLSDKFGKDCVTGTGRNQVRCEELKEMGHTICIGDLSARDFVINKLQNFTHIIHCAAKSSPWGSYNSFYQDNVVTTRNLLEGIPSIRKFVYISTPSIYFNYSDRFGIKEDSQLPKNFVNDYAATKYLGEREVLNFPKQDMIRIIIRPRAIVGAGDTVIVPRVIRAFEAGKLRIIGDGKNVCDFSSVKNIAHAIYLSIIGGPEIDGKIFNITDDSPKPMWELIENSLIKLGYHPQLKPVNYRLVFAFASISELINKLLKRKEPVLTRYGVAVLRYSITLDISEAKKYLKYEPVISTDESIDEFVKSFRNEK